MYTRGFTLMEILVIVSIIVILSAIGVLQFMEMRDRAELTSTARTLVAHLEESKSRAVAGLYGDSHGIHITSDAYTQFSGDTYDLDDETNQVHEISDGLTLDTSGDSDVIFARITGGIDEVVTITVALEDDPTQTRDILIGTGGAITLSDD